MDVLEDLTEPFDPRDLPWLDRPQDNLTGIHKQWHEQGYAVLENFMPHDMIDAYCEEYLGVHGTPLSAGWRDCTPYMRYPALRDLCCETRLSKAMSSLMGEQMGVHLNLTGWVSTQRNWHQDGYLNPDHVVDHYIAAWIALDDIDPDSGPFQMVPGSHRWPIIRQDRMLAALTPEERSTANWPKHSERILTPYFDAKLMSDPDAEVVTYLPSKGDVLLWHARLLHRGSRPMDGSVSRPVLIAHYSGVNHRPDMPKAVRNTGRGSEGWCFPIDIPTNF